MPPKGESQDCRNQLPTVPGRTTLVIATFFAAADQERTDVGTTNDSRHRTMVARNDWGDIVGTLQKVMVEVYGWLVPDEIVV